MRSCAPSAKTISVALGASETMRVGAAASVRLLPRASTTVTGYATADALGLETAGGALTPPPHETTNRRAPRNVTSRIRIRRTLSREGVSAASGSQATRVRTFVLHGGATLPESHRLR